MSAQPESRVMRLVRQLEEDEVADPRMSDAERKSKFITLREEMFAWEAVSSTNPLGPFDHPPTGEFDIAELWEHYKKIAAWPPLRGRAAG